MMQNFEDLYHIPSKSSFDGHRGFSMRLNFFFVFLWPPRGQISTFLLGLQYEKFKVSAVVPAAGALSMTVK